MELYKLDNGKPKKFKGGFVVYNNRIYTNPKEEVIRLVGYKDLVYSEKPEYDEGTQYLKEVYTEDDNSIKVGYEILDISEEN